MAQAMTVGRYLLERLRQRGLRHIFGVPGDYVLAAYYTSMGFAIPASVGAQVGRRRARSVVFVGDGAFQMTGTELSTVVRQRLNPIIFVLNNKGYATERMIHEGPYNDILDWSCHRVPQVLGSGWGCEVRTEGELECALEAARANTRGFSIINLHLDKLDCSDALARLGKRFGKRLDKRLDKRLGKRLDKRLDKKAGRRPVRPSDKLSDADVPAGRWFPWRTAGAWSLECP